MGKKEPCAWEMGVQKWKSPLGRKVTSTFTVCLAWYLMSTHRKISGLLVKLVGMLSIRFVWRKPQNVGVVPLLPRISKLG